MSFPHKLHRLQSKEMLYVRTFFFQWLSMHYPNLNFTICEECASVIHFVSQKRLDPFKWRSSLESHFLTYGEVFMARKMIEFFNYF